ncbi:hypothetical protein ACIA58_18990 [Kribbella sp. NPDC051586]|uniref:hypothetical protein n=1 Tax=Kribbella sp. NPDC051586 TaxID=3364118 RepID=UPI0037B8629A
MALAVSADGQCIYVGRIYEAGIVVLDAAGPTVIGTIELPRCRAGPCAEPARGV